MVSARIEVQSLLQSVLKVSRAHLLAHPEQLLGNEQQSAFNGLFERRMGGEPIAYLLGEREFYGMTFKVSPATLIPRPETELLVELALQRIPALETCRVLDLGTGCGAIALSIAQARPNAEVVAVDYSIAALGVAKFNSAQFGLENVRLLQSDWFDALHGECFDIIVSNPPYIAENDSHLAQGDVRFEPRNALVAGTDGMDDIRRISAEAKNYLNANGCLLVEHGYDQGVRVRELLSQHGYGEILTVRDLSGIDRVCIGS